MQIELNWETDKDATDVIGYRVGYSIGKTSVTFGTNWLIPRDLPNLTLNLASMDSRQLYSFWVSAVDAAGNVGKKRYLMNVYKP